MARRDILVIGASAGGVKACCEVVKGLSAELPAAVFIVVHVGAASALPSVLAKCTAFKIASATDGEAIRHRQAYVAPPDHHLLLHNGRIRLSRGPRENRHRPSVDALFRSAARAYHSRVIAVVLSGALDDGAAGALAVKQRGGLVIVQDPATAFCRSMPENALRAAAVDYVVPLSEIPALLKNLVSQEMRMTKNSNGAGKLKNGMVPGPAPFVCPDCGGPLFQDKEGPSGQLKCLVGHSYGPDSLSEAHRDALERAVLTTMRLLQERSGVHRHLARAKGEERNSNARQHFRECAEDAERDVTLLREILERI